jgi:ribonuclease E
MAGLVVIDFIDMEYGSNVRKVEKAMKDALRNDRARIQVGRISGFGLMEMSRQRLRTGVLEATTRQCPHCDGTGLVRTASSAGLSALRLIEDEAAKGKGTTITLYASSEAAIYLLNAKRADLAEIEARYGVTVEVVPEGEEEGAKMRVASTGPRPTSTPRFEPIVEEVDDLDLIDEDEDEEDEEEDDREAPRERESGEQGGKRRRRRRGGRGRNREHEEGEERPLEEGEEPAEEFAGERTEEGAEERPKKRRRRGGRRRNKHREGLDDGTDNETVAEEAELIPETAEGPGTDDQPVAGASLETAEGETPKRRSRRKKVVEDAIEQAPVAEDEPSRMAPTGEEAPVAEEAAKPKRRSRAKKPEPSEADAPAASEAEASPEQQGSADPVTAVDPEPARPKRSRRKAAVEKSPEAAESAPSAANDANGGEPAEEESGSPRRGWWQRTFGN